MCQRVYAVDVHWCLIELAPVLERIRGVGEGMLSCVEKLGKQRMEIFAD